jgi:hypothetical protein
MATARSNRTPAFICVVSVSKVMPNPVVKKVFIKPELQVLNGFFDETIGSVS